MDEIHLWCACFKQYCFFIMHCILSKFILFGVHPWAYGREKICQKKFPCQTPPDSYANKFISRQYKRTKTFNKIYKMLTGNKTFSNLWSTHIKQNLSCYLNKVIFRCRCYEVRTFPYVGYVSGCCLEYVYLHRKQEAR